MPINNFSIDEITPINPTSNLFTVTIIPDIKTNNFGPMQTRSIYVRGELLEEQFYDSVISKWESFGQNNVWPRKFLSSVVQGAYYRNVNLPRNYSDIMITPELNIFADRIQPESPYLTYPIEEKFVDYSVISNSNKGDGEALYLYGLYVGQGDSLLIICPNDSVYLVDTNYYWINKDILKEINNILSLHNLPTNHIKALIITHKHLDHIRGAWKLLNQFEVEYFLINYDYDHPTKPVQLLLDAANQHVNHLVNVNRQGIIHEGEVCIQIKNPDANTKDVANAPDINDSSIALDIEYHGHHIFLTGDAGFPTICSKYKSYPTSDNILKISHHGSRNGTSIQVMNNLNPKYCFISAGNHKRFNHPHSETVSLINGTSDLYISKDLGKIIKYKVNDTDVSWELIP